MLTTSTVHNGIPLSTHWTVCTCPSWFHRTCASVGHSNWCTSSTVLTWIYWANLNTRCCISIGDKSSLTLSAYWRILTAVTVFTIWNYTCVTVGICPGWITGTRVAINFIGASTINTRVRITVIDVFCTITPSVANCTYACSTWWIWRPIHTPHSASWM